MSLKRHEKGNQQCSRRATAEFVETGEQTGKTTHLASDPILGLPTTPAIGGIV